MKHTALVASVLGLSISVVAQHLEPLTGVVRLEPSEVAGVLWMDGAPVLTTDWIPYGGTAHHCSRENCWDSFEADENGAPSDGEKIGCGPSCRWFFGASYCSGGSVMDISDVACPGISAKEVGFGWFFQPEGPIGDGISIIIITAEDDWPASFGCGFSLSSPYPGVAYRFTDPFSLYGYYYSHPNLCGTPLSHQLPLDGNGTAMLIFRGHDPRYPPPCAQPMLWGTHEDDVPMDRRPGTQHRFQFDDDNPIDGEFHPSECYEYNYGLVPTELCPMLIFRGGCDPCDVNCDGSVNSLDIEPFVQALSPSPPAACSPCAADANADGSVNTFDIQGFVECLSG